MRMCTTEWSTLALVLFLMLTYPATSEAQWSNWSKLGPFGWGEGTELHMPSEYPDWRYMTSSGDLYRRIDDEQQWYRISPERLTKEGFRIRIPSDDPSTIYAVERYESRIFVSHDAGRSWERFFETDREGYVEFIDPDDPQHIIFNHTPHDAPNRLIQTFNKGKGWYEMTSRFEDGNQFFSTIVNESNPDEIIIAHYITHTEVTYYITQNGGDAWQQMEGVNLRSIDEVLFAPEPSDRILMKGVLGWRKSTDRGRSWSRWQGDGSQRIKLQQHPTDPDRLLRVVSENNQGPGRTIEISRDAGQTWSELVRLPDARRIFDMQFAINHPHDLWVVTNPNGLMSVAADGTRQPLYNDSGASPPVNALEYYDGRLLTGLERGRLLSTQNLGNQWSPRFETFGFHGMLRTDADGDGGIYTNVFPGHPDYPDSLRYEVGVYSMSSDYGQHWTHKKLPYYGLETFDVAQDGKIVYGDYYRENSDNEQYAGILRSRDYGESWQELSFDFNYPVERIHKIEIAPNNPDKVYAYVDLERRDSEGEKSSVGHLLRTNNGGESWQILRRGMEGPFFLVPGEAKTIVYGDEDYFYRSTDAGETWTEVGRMPDPVYNYNHLKDLEVFPNNPERMVAVTLDGRFILTEDGGANWAVIGTPPKENWYAEQVELNFQHSDQWQLYVGTLDGVYMTHRGELQYDPPVTNETPTDDIPQRITLNNYPNPFNPTTTIEYTLNEPGRVEFTIYNTVGQPVRNIDRGYRIAGTYSFQYTPENLSSGVYLYRLRVRDQTVVEKFTLIK